MALTKLEKKEWGGDRIMKCPKCGKQLKIITLHGERFYSHTYSLSYVMGDKSMCDYSQALAPNQE